MTATHPSIEPFVSEEEQRLLQALPFLFSFGLTLYMPIAARKSLSAFRALQVYDSQEPPKKGFTGERQRKRWEKYMTYFWCLSPSVFQIIGLIPIKNETNWPIYSTIRRYTPFAFLAVLLSLSSFNVFAPLLIPIQRVGRELGPNDKKTKEKKAAYISITRNNTKQPNSLAHFVMLFSICMPIAAAWYFANSSGSISIIVTLATACTILTLPSLITPMAFQEKTSLRSHVTFIVLLFIGTVAVWLAIFVIALCGTYLYLTYLSFYPATTTTSKSEKGEISDDSVDVVTSQVACLTYTAIWPVFMAYPAFLMNLAYRFDASKAGLTQVTDEQKKEAILESREVAKQCRTLKHPKHHYDNVGRTPIVLDSLALRLPQKLTESELPIFSATMKTMIASQAASLLILWGYAPPWFNMTYFVRSQEAAKALPFPITVNFGVLLPLFIMVPVMLFSAGYDAKKNGETFGSGVRAIWTYEEKWGADYYQTKIDLQMDVMDTPEEFKDEKQDKILADNITKEDLEVKDDLNA